MHTVTKLRSRDWFNKKIGSTIYGAFGCNCSACNIQHLTGVTIADLNHVESLLIIQENTTRRYFESKEEREKYE